MKDKITLKFKVKVKWKVKVTLIFKVKPRSQLKSGLIEGWDHS